MAYVKHIDHRCRIGGCSARATKEVFNSRNSSQGYFCTSHARLEINKLTKDEKYLQELTQDRSCDIPKLGRPNCF